jgi:hypothetical protein
MEALRDSHHDMSKWEQEAQLERERVSKLEAAAGLVWGARDYFERSREIGEQARREALHEKWDREGGPESYRRRRVFIPAEAFVSTLAVLQRTILTLSRFELGPDIDSGIKQAADDLARALPGLKGVRDSVAHKDERVRGLAYKKKIETQPVSNALIHAPAGGAMIIGSLNNNNYGGTIADGNYAEVEIADATTEVARQAVQAVYDALPWRRGHRLLEPIS